ncbi:uncharacterized protein DUF2851 [Balneicella halophila]|uniref:Uncharacterized protein DUF2851 n=1 Tax=Balneicella halophila TaxID=1537566 RepID=A0A7L4UQK2_BALHA|nr:DUF2851 family protein [Balneicella halophila]PVX51721.1 uncharacterized protein DUF2851 [Balneicella halophila]
MNEEFLYYIWQHHVRLQVKYDTVEGISFVVLNKGFQNTNAGADVSHVKLKIDDVEWSGCVEFHIKSSDWYTHNHHSDPAYNNVVLHFVSEKDRNVYTEDGRELLTFIFPDLLKYYNIFQNTFSSKQFIYCEKHFARVSSFIKNMWLQRLVIERSEAKTETVFHLLSQNNNDWEETAYQLFVRYLGQKLNGDIFEQLARRLPQNILAKHKSSLLQIEALLFGQAGMLEDEIDDSYFKKLKTEYQFLQRKYDLAPMEVSQWKYLRLRPANFPSLRIAQLAMLIHKSSGIFSQLLNIEQLESLRKLFEFGTSEYWCKHYVFGKESARESQRKIGEKLQDILIINSVVPLLFAYSQYIGDIKWQEKALRLLGEIDAESNYIIHGFNRLGQKPKSSYDTQALIQLKNNYCDFRRCEQCTIGHEILKTCYI